MAVDPEAPVGAPEPAAPEPAPEPAAPAPTPGDAPWSQDLLQAFPDEAVRGQVDGFLRQRVQPRITHLEQETAPARELYSDLLRDPRGTLRAVVEELYGEEYGEIGDKFESLFGEPEPPAAPEPAQQGEVPPHIQEMYEQFEADRRAQLYAQQLEAVKAANPDLHINEGVFHAFVASAEGDLNAAVAGYRQFLGEWQQAHGQPAPTPEPEPAAPAALGTTPASGTAPTPVEKKYDSIDDALDDFLAEQRAARTAPTTVGSV